MTFRTSKMIESLTEVAAASEEISVSEYLERSTKASFDQVMVDRRDEGEPNTGRITVSEGRPLSQIAEELYDEDDVKCLLKRLYNHPWSLSREQIRLLKLIEISPVLHPEVHEYDEGAIREVWTVLDAIANRNAPLDTLPAGLFGNADIEFALMSEADQIKVYRANKDNYFRRSETHLSKGGK